MFLHELTRRFFCRSAFVFFCFVPTTCVLAWGVARRTSGHRDAYAEAIAQSTGLEVSLASVGHPRPGALLFNDLTLAEPETGDRVLHCRVVEVSETAEQQIVRASQIEVEATQAARLWEMAELKLRRSTAGDDVPVRFLASELTWQGGGVAQTLVDVDASLQSTDVGRRADMSFRLPGTGADKPVTVHVARNQQTKPVTTELQLNTGACAVPCAAFAPLVDGGAWFGSRATFKGWFQVSRGEGDWSGELSGEFNHVDLDTLVTARFPHTLSGEATVHIERARLVGGRLAEAEGTITAGPGVVSRSLIASGAERLRLGADTDVSAGDAVVRFERLHFDFSIDDAGLQIVGRAGGTRGAMLVERNASGVGRALWVQPVDQPQPVVALVQALVPMSDVQVPAHESSRWLIERLPMPKLVPPRGASLPTSGHLKR